MAKPTADATSKTAKTSAERLNVGLNIILRLRSSGPDKLVVSQKTEINILKALNNLLAREYPKNSKNIVNAITTYRRKLEMKISINKTTAEVFYYDLANNLQKLLRPASPALDTKKIDTKAHADALIQITKNGLNTLLTANPPPQKIATEINTLLKNASYAINLARTPDIEPYRHIKNVLQTIKVGLTDIGKKKPTFTFFNKEKSISAFVNHLNKKLDQLSLPLENTFRSHLQDVFYHTLAGLGKKEKINLSLNLDKNPPAFKTHVAVDALIEKVISRQITQKEALKQLPEIVEKYFKITPSSLRKSI